MPSIPSFFSDPLFHVMPPRFQLQLLRGRAFATTRSANIVLRPYQEVCIQACLEALEAGSTRIGVSLPTGSGKTTIFLSLLSRIVPPRSASDATRALIIVNSVELARQTAEQAGRVFPGCSVEIEQGSQHVASGDADITIATYQTLLKPKRLAKFQPSRLKAVVVDEAHHAAAPSYRQILSTFHDSISQPGGAASTMEKKFGLPILGFSATFSRHDGLALGSVFERIVYHIDFLDMIREKWLSDVRFTTVRADINLSGVTMSSQSGDFNATSLAHVINTDTLNQLVVRTWLDRAASCRKSTIIFCVNLQHVRFLTDAFRNAGVDARYVHAGTPAAARVELIAGFKRGEFPVLVNCAVLTEGTDIPCVDCVVIARPTRSRNLFSQMIGRGMRLSPETAKVDCHIIDLVDSVDRVSGIVSTPSLFGLDPNEVIEDTPLGELRGRNAYSKSNDRTLVPSPQNITYVDYEDPFSLIDHASGAPHVFKMSPNAWVGCGDNIYVLDCLGNGFVRTDALPNPSDGEPRFRAVYVPATLPMGTAKALKISPYRRGKQILTAGTLADAVKGCDTYVKANVMRGPALLGLRRAAKWRSGEVTDTQKAFLRKWTGSRPTSVVHKVIPLDICSLNKGQAANIITRIKHGALARYKNKAKVATKAASSELKERNRQAKEHVRVGPLVGDAKN